MDTSPLLPVKDGDTVITVCQRIGFALHYEQRLFSRSEIQSAGAFDACKNELSHMLARLEHARTEANRMPPT